MSEYELVLDAQSSAREIVRVLDSADATLSDNGGVELISIRPRGFLRVGEIALVTAWARHKRRAGFQVQLSTPDLSITNYWERMKALELMKAKNRPSLRSLPNAGRLVEMHAVTTSSIGPALDAIMDFLMHAYVAKSNQLEVMEWILSEMLDNVVEHAEDPDCALTVAQRYGSEVELAVVDRGIGLAKSLGRVTPGVTDSDAVDMAVQEGVSGKGEGRGKGLAGIAQISESNGGRFELLSGSAIRIQVGASSTVLPEQRFQGTYASVSLRLDHTIDLSETLIGDLDWTYVDGLLDVSGELVRIAVRERVETVATREAAARFATYLINLLGKSAEPIVLDFAGATPSSAFVGGLFSRLEEQLPGDWQKMIVLDGLNDFAISVVNRAAVPFGTVQIAERM